MKNKNKEINEGLELKAFDGYKVPEGEFKEFLFVNKATGKTTKGINLNGEEVSFIYKKLVNDEWIEISREEMPKGTIMRAENYSELCKTSQEDKTSTKSEEISQNLSNIANKFTGLYIDLELISSLLSVLEDATKEENYRISHVIREIGEKTFQFSNELGKVESSIREGLKTIKA